MLWSQAITAILIKSMNMTKLDQWAIELAGYSITFVHIKDSNNILVDAISRLKIQDIYKDPATDCKKPQVTKIHVF